MCLTSVLLFESVYSLFIPVRSVSEYILMLSPTQFMPLWRQVKFLMICCSLICFYCGAFTADKMGNHFLFDNVQQLKGVVGKAQRRGIHCIRCFLKTTAV